MQPKGFTLTLLISTILLLPAGSSAGGKDIPSIAEITKNMERFDGFLPFYWDRTTGKVWVEVGRFGEEFLYTVSLPAGVGSNDIGLDRGQLGGSHVVSFYRSGPKVLLVEPNYEYRAISSNTAEQRAVRDAFATSVLAGFTVEAEEDGRVLVDATRFLLSDAHGVIGALGRSGQGTYTLDEGRSVFYTPAMKNFPRNTEVEVVLTFSGKNPGSWIRSVTPTPEAVTVRQRHSFVQLPDKGYQPRRFDPRGGFFGIQYADYAVPIGEPLVQKFIARHRLVKKDPDAAVSEPIAPIVYYVDPGTPEPIRTALIEGAQWWDQAFRAAGFINAFRVEVLPEDADPLDVRYNVIQWVHRSTRGWSYGATITDPRTGEIIKGHVSLGSLRARQDFLIAEGLLAPYEAGADVPSGMEQMALARLRQLSAHEVGHTLGLAHNYVSSSFDRASVMDYPHPYAQIAPDGTLDLSDAYDTGIGRWDEIAITFGYREHPGGTDPDEASQRVITDALKDGLVFLTDQDARSGGSSHPTTHLWDNGKNAVDELDRMMTVRRAALDKFSENVIPVGRPMAMLEEALVPLYLGHRYQVEAAIKSIAGATYTFAHRGDGQLPVRAVAADEQRRALAAVLRTVSPDALTLPERIVSLIPPRPYGYGAHRELFSSGTSPLFDRLAPARAATHHVFGLLFNTQRANRLVQQHAVDENLPGLAEMLDVVMNDTWFDPAPKGGAGEVSREVGSIALEYMLSLSVDPEASTQTRAIAALKARDLRSWLQQQLKKGLDAGRKAHLEYAASRIDRRFEDPDEFTPQRAGSIPPGQPIGMDEIGCSLEW